MGTVIAGKPVRGEKSWLLSPCGVLRSPMSRGGLLHVGYTSASSLSESMSETTAARNRSRDASPALQPGVPSGGTVSLSAFCRRNCALG